MPARGQAIASGVINQTCWGQELLGRDAAGEPPAPAGRLRYRIRTGGRDDWLASPRSDTGRTLDSEGFRRVLPRRRRLGMPPAKTVGRSLYAAMISVECIISTCSALTIRPNCSVGQLDIKARLGPVKSRFFEFANRPANRDLAVAAKRNSMRSWSGTVLTAMQRVHPMIK